LGPTGFAAVAEFPDYEACFVISMRCA
jgi:hypothetical protein